MQEAHRLARQEGPEEGAEKECAHSIRLRRNAICLEQRSPLHAPCHQPFMMDGVALIKAHITLYKACVYECDFQATESADKSAVQA